MKSKSTLEEKLNFKVLINGSRHFIVKLSKSFKKTTEHQHFSNSISIWFKTKAPDVDAIQNLRSCLSVFVDTLKRRGHKQQAAHRSLASLDQLTAAAATGLHPTLLNTTRLKHSKSIQTETGEDMRNNSFIISSNVSEKQHIGTSSASYHRKHL